MIIRDDAVSEIFGYLILMGIVVLGISIILLSGAYVIPDSKETAQFNTVEQAFTVGDSRMSKARFSTSIFQETPFEFGDGTVFVNGTEDDSYIAIYGADQKLIHRCALGTVKYVGDNGEIAYQGGGVWVKYPNGGTIMRSPPDFNYNGVTLTLPITRIDGNTSIAVNGGGAVMLDASSPDGVITPIYPGIKGMNPVPQNYSINITIKSDYYSAWADYINERTSAIAVTDPSKKIVNVSLKTGIPLQNKLAIDGFTTEAMDTDDPTPIEVFILNLTGRNPGNCYTLTYCVPDIDGAEPDPQLYIIVTRLNGKIKDEAGVPVNENKNYGVIEFKYIDKANGIEEVFANCTEYQRQEFREDSLYIDMLNQSYVLNYHSTNPTVTWGTDQANFDTGLVIGYDDSSDIMPGGSKTLHDITQHYLWLMAKQYPDDGPDYDIAEKKISGLPGGPTGNNNFKFNPDESRVFIKYRSGQDIKYLYITEGVLKVGLSSKTGSMQS
ncbi:hypothetical protein CUJ83_06970 [Methanocella sp. CWC-04]|uniref:Archaeal Type IV pilin N-terminal domain-containing protein n=2 Tax=Methanooceanicella nereidis TaxID=2052831 RepID=A0AAP2RC08_9EURY|nr:hypothetical protein [Methanocella sp. CWC-04]